MIDLSAFPDRQAFYRSLLPKIRGVAEVRGYAIGVHGSETRDFDLMAMPWVDWCVAPDELASQIAAAVEGHIQRKGANQLAGLKPLGRRAYTIVWDQYVVEKFPHPDGWDVFIDLSVGYACRCHIGGALAALELDPLPAMPDLPTPPMRPGLVK